MSNNLETIFSMRTESEEKQGKFWYADSTDYLKSLAVSTKVPFKLVCGIVAALSPRVSWRINIHNTIALCKNQRITGLKSNIDKAKKIKKTGIVSKYLRGPKVTSFFLNLLGNVDEITIDTLMINCYHNSFERHTLTVRERSDLLSTIERIARRHRLTNCQVQAIIWVVWHRVTKSNFPGYVSFLKIF
jgi:hypothetical protein